MVLGRSTMVLGRSTMVTGRSTMVSGRSSRVLGRSSMAMEGLVCSRAFQKHITLRDLRLAAENKKGSSSDAPNIWIETGTYIYIHISR